MNDDERKELPTAGTSVHACMAKARALLPAIGKNHKNANQGWKYRGIDDVQNVLGAALSEAGLVLYPEYELINSIPNESGKGFTVFLRATYEFVSVHDGSICAVTFVGQGTDPGDKAVGKAKAVCFKYMAFQTFQIPVAAGVLDDNDSESPTSVPDKKWR